MDGSIGRNRQALAGDRNARPEREFLRARRHSRRVRLLKIGLPVIATLIVLVALLLTWLARSLPVDLSAASTSIENGRLVMQDPRMSGVDGNTRPYSMTAARAIQSLTGGGIDLEGVKASLTVDENTTADLTARNGRFDPKGNTLRLFDDITVNTTSGIEVKLDSADIALADGRLEGSGPVSVQTPNQRLESGNVTISEGGKRLTFGGRVRLTLLPTNSSGSDTLSSEQTP